MQRSSGNIAVGYRKKSLHLIMLLIQGSSDSIVIFCRKKSLHPIVPFMLIKSNNVYGVSASDSLT